MRLACLLYKSRLEVCCHWANSSSCVFDINHSWWLISEFFFQKEASRLDARGGFTFSCSSSGSWSSWQAVGGFLQNNLFGFCLEKTPFTFELKSFKNSAVIFKSRYSSLEAYNWCLDKLTFYYWIVYGNVVKIVENILLRKWIEKDYLEPILICSIALEVRIILILLTAGKVILSIGYFLLVVWVITFSN